MTISYDDFAKVEIRIGKVLDVEVVENADKLLKLTVDFGPTLLMEEATFSEENSPVPKRDIRTVVSGIREHVTAEEIIGKKFPFVVNLESRLIKGIESEAMIMAASAEAVFSLLRVNQEIPEGTKIR